MDLSKTVRNKKSFFEPKAKVEDNPILTTKKTMVQLILEFVEKNPDCLLRDIYNAYPQYDQAHMRSKIRRLILN
jgi:hypothetical protein